MEYPTWTPGKTPLTKKGSARRFFVTAKHKQTGKKYVWPMVYFNRHVMALNDDTIEPPDCAVPCFCHSDGSVEEYEWTGWSSGECEYCQTSWMFEEHHFEIIAFMDGPEAYEGGEA